jgi:hypothetical protein
MSQDMFPTLAMGLIVEAGVDKPGPALSGTLQVTLV